MKFSELNIGDTFEVVTAGPRTDKRYKKVAVEWCVGEDGFRLHITNTGLPVCRVRKTIVEEPTEEPAKEGE